MSPATFLFLAIVALVAAVYLSASAFGKRGFVGSMVVILLIVVVVMAEVMGRPKPTDLEWRSPESARVIFQKPVKGGVFAVLSVDGALRCYRYDGGEKPEQIQKEFRRGAVEHEGQMELLNPFGQTPTMRGLRRQLPEKSQ